jgi:putative ubiquitin-RnfH superfamily antitoxin RatB of RatAB toxin-antitoxin module
MASGEPDLLRVSVVYLRPDLSFERELVLPAPATVGEAIEASGVRAEVPELRGLQLQVGVFSRLCRPSDPVHDGDRVEIYRTLTLDPKESRRIRAAIRRRRKAAAKAPPR